MSSLPHEQTASPPRAVPLGRLLVERGLLTEEQLIEGLLEQDRTGDRLGKVLIRLGFVEEPSVAMALASQHGGPLKTEYGFATGFPPGGPTEPVTEPPLSSDPAASEPLPSELLLSRLPDVIDGASPVHAEPAASPATILAPAATGAADEIAEAPGQIAPDQTVATIAAPASAQAELDAAHTRIGDLERELVATREQLDERRSKITELEDKFATAQLAAETAIAALRGVIEARP